MLGKNIRIHLKKKIQDWASSVEDPEVKKAILEKTLITGGAIVSLLQDEDPNDYDVYFRDAESCKLVAQYYVNQFIDAASKKKKDLPQIELQRCRWVEKTGEGGKVTGCWAVLKGEERCEDERIRVFIRSQGAVGEDFDPYGEQSDNYQYRKALAKISAAMKKAGTEEEGQKKKDKKPYHTKFITNNAISLSDDIQIVLRFYGEPAEIHKNYDFVHCSSYYTSWDDKLELPSRALEAIINKELFYMGSRYPLCSIIRTRKFMGRGWHINAGQYVKLVLQLNEMDLKNLHVFEEQLIGVDSAYFTGLISSIEKMRHDHPDFEPDTGYLIKLIDQIFEDKQIDACGEEEDDDSSDQEGCDGADQL